MSNPYDAFDAPTQPPAKPVAQANPYDQFYAPTSTPAIGAAPNPYDVFDSPDKAIEYASANYHDPATQDAAFEAYKQKSKTPITVGSAAKATGQFLKAAIPTKDDQGEWQWPLVSGAWQMAKRAAQTAKNIGETQGTSPKTRIFSIIPGIGPFAAATAAAWNEDPSAERAGRQLGVGAESGALAAARMVAHARQNLSGLASAITGGNIGTQAGDLSDADLRKRFNDEVEAHYLQSQMAQGRYASEAEGGPDVMRTPEELAAKGAPINPEEIQGIASTTNPTNLAELGALTNPLAKGVMAPLVRARAATAETAGNLVGKIPRSLSPLAAVASAFHGNPLGNAVAEGIAGAAATKAAPAVGSAVGSFLRDNAAQMAGEAPRVGQSAIRKVANAGFQGAAGGVPVGAAFALGGENSEEMGQQFFGAIGLGGILSATSAAPRAGKAGAIEQAAVARQLSREGAAANFGVGYDAFHQDAMKSVSPQEAELINKYRGFVSRLRAPDGKPIQIYAVTGDKFGAIQKQMGEVDAQGNPTNPNGRGLITPDGSQLFINVHSQGNLNAPLAHETGHAAEVASQFANQILKQSLSATIAEHLYGPNGLPTPDFMQFIDQYSKAVGAAKARSMTDRDFQSEFIAETARHLLSGGNIEQYALPKGMMDGVQDWIQNKLGIKPDAGKLGFDGTEVSAITKKVGEMLRSVGTTKPTDTSAQFRIDQLKQIIDQPPGKAATIEQLDQYAAAKKEYDDLLKKQATANPSAAFPAAGAPPVAPSAPKTPADIQRFNDAKAALVALGHKAGAAIAAIKEAEKQHGEPIDKTENLVKGAQRILQNLTVAPGQYKPGWVKPLAPIPPVDTTKTFNDPNGVPQKITGESADPVKVGDHVLTEAGIVRKVVRIHSDGGLDVIAPNTTSTITTQPVKAGRFRVLTTETTTPQAAAAETPQNTVKPGPGGTFIIVDAAGNPINKRTYKTQASAERVAAGQGKANKFKLKPNPNPDVPDVIDAILEQGGVNLSGLSKEEAAVFIRDQYLRTLLSDPAGQPPDEIARLLAATEEGGQSFGDGDIRTLSDLIADAYRARQIGESPESAAEKAEKQARAEAAKQPVPPAQPTPNAPTEPPPSEPVPSPTVSTIERTPAPDAPAEPGALSRLQINETAKAAREAFLADKEPAKSGKNKGQHTKENQKAADRAAFQAVAEAYVATLPPNYEGIKLTESPLGFPEVSGTVKPGRAFDDYLLELAGVTPEQLQTIGDIQNRIGQTISVQYAHAAGKPGEPNYAATRRAAQKASPAKGRIERGEGQEETKVFLPQKLKFNFGSKTFTVLGTNVEKLLSNFGWAEEAMQQVGEEMPYRDIHDPKLVADLKGLQANHDAGFTWDGSPIQGLVDRPLATNRPSAEKAPYQGFLDEEGMPDLHRFEFLNLLLGNEGARIGKRGPTDIQKAKLTLGEMNRGDVSDPVTAEGETNQLRDRLNAALGPQEVLDADGKPTGETDRWSKVFMEDPLDEALSIENVTKINPEVERGSSPLHENDYRGDLDRHFGKLKPGNTEQERIAAAGRFLPEEAGAENASESVKKRAAQLWKEKGTESPFFKKWFGASKVVDERGQPKPAYHGTVDASFSVFDSNKQLRDSGWYGRGAYFTLRPSEVNGYTADATGKVPKSAGVYKVFLKIESPLRVENRNDMANQIQKLGGDPNLEGKKLADEIQRLGFDGVMTHDEGEVVVFKPEQIKSATGNQGTFDPKNPDIRFLPEDASVKGRAKQRTEDRIEKRELHGEHDGSDIIGVLKRDGISGLRQKVFQENPIVPKFTATKGYLGPENEWIQNGEHLHMAREGIAAMIKAGFVRTAFSYGWAGDNGKKLYYEGKPSSRQLQELKNTAIERGAELVHDKSKDNLSFLPESRRSPKEMAQERIAKREGNIETKATNHLNAIGEKWKELLKEAGEPNVKTKVGKHGDSIMLHVNIGQDGFTTLYLTPGELASVYRKPQPGDVDRFQARKTKDGWQIFDNDTDKPATIDTGTYSEKQAKEYADSYSTYNRPYFKTQAERDAWESEKNRIAESRKGKLIMSLHDTDIPKSIRGKGVLTKLLATARQMVGKDLAEQSLGVHMPMNKEGWRTISRRAGLEPRFLPESKDDARDIAPAIKINGKLVKGQKGDTHQDILDRHMAENPDDVDALMDFDTKANPNFFVTKDGQEISREQLKERFGVSDSQGLRRIQGGGAKFMPEEGIGGYADPRFDIPEKQQERISGVAHRRVRRVFPDLNDETDAYRMKVERLITELSNEWAHQHPRPAQQPSARRGVLDADHIVRQITREEAKDLASEEGTWWLFSRMEDGSEGEVAPVAKPYVPKQEAIIMAIEQAKEYGEMKIGTFEKQSPTSEGFPLYRITDQDGTWFVTDPAGNNVNYASTRAEAERLVEAYNRRADALPQGELPEGYRLEQHGNAHVLYGPGLETGRTMRSATRAQALSEARQMASDAAAEHRETTRSSQEQAAPKKFTPTGDTEHDIGSLNSMTLSRLGDISQRAFKRRLREMIQAGEPPSLKLAERVLTDLQRESRSSMPRLPQPRGELSKKSPLADVHTDLDNKIVEQQADIEKEIKALTEQIDEYDAPQGNYENRIQRAELEELRRSFVEDHANLHSLRESLRLANPTTLDQFPRAFAEIRRLEVRGLISHEAKERAYETLSDRQNTEIARQIIAEEEARPQRERQSRIDAKIRVAQREAAKTRTEQQTMWDELLQAKDAKNLPKVAKLWLQVSRNDDAFSFPRSSAKEPAEIAKEMSKPGHEISARSDGSYQIQFRSGNGSINVQDINGRPEISAPGAGSRGKKQGGGSQLYQAAFAWAHNNGKVIYPSNALSPINAYVRRTSNMLSSALRFGTTRHMIPDNAQGVKNWVDSNDFKDAKAQKIADANNIAQLAIRERDQVLKAVPSLNTLDFDFKSGKIKDQNGKEITPQELGKLLEAEGKSKTYDMGIGLSTAQRAIITNSAMREAEAGTLAGTDRGRGNRLVKEQRSLLYLPESPVTGKEKAQSKSPESRAAAPRQQASSIKAAAQDRMKRRRELQTR